MILTQTWDMGRGGNLHGHPVGEEHLRRVLECNRHRLVEGVHYPIVDSDPVHIVLDQLAVSRGEC